MSVDWTRFAERIKPLQTILLTSHVRPDCDALGSELGMALLLEALGKQVRIVNPQATPAMYAFLDPHQRIRPREEVSDQEIAECDGLIILDTSAWAQLGCMAEVVRASEACKLLVDHHVGEDDLGAELFKDRQAEATGWLVYDAARCLNVPLTPEMAEPLFAAVATDTGWFRFSSTRPQTFACAADLVRAGARPTWIYDQLYQRDTVARVRLRGRVLERLQCEDNGELAYTFVTMDDLKELGALPSDTEDLVNEALGIAGVTVSLIFIEQPEQKVKVSFRSRGTIDCNQVARQFGGGGHREAAGATVAMALAEAERVVLDAVRKAKQNQS
ncbi:MAG: phosphodiesterase [Pirellulaceae bacterium]|nr:MAG: phosphodiesterase [Pirellulaceae bacterium]GIW93287.1 MAG: phosphodiesterase [Pirellulaceae bacterium]